MKTAIVTGALGNLGQAVVKKFVAQGFRVVGTIAPGEEAPISASHDNFTTAPVDLTNETDVEKFITNTTAKYQKIDAAVLTAGGFAMGTVSETKTSDIAKQYQLNFETAYNIARPVFNNMRQNKTGRIFLIGSRPGIDAADGKGMIGYSLAKFLIFRLAELMNDEAKVNIVTGLVVPRTIDTPTNRKAMPGADFNVRVKPEAIADVIYFYCTEEAAVLREPVIKVYNNS